jgi:cytochrome P450
LLTSFADCEAVLRDPRTSVDRTLATVPLSRFPVQDLIPADADAAPGEPSFLFVDPPDHTRLRRLVSKAFTPRTVQRLQPRIAELIDDALDGVAGTFDVVAELAYPLPVAVICELLGVPLTDEADLSRWSSLMARTLDPTSRSTAALQVDPDELLHAAMSLHGYFDRLSTDRRNDPGDDLLSRLIAAEDAGDSLTHEELISTCSLLLIAGHETTVNLLGNGLLTLLRNPPVLDHLRQTPQLIPAAVEEMLRYEPPVQFLTNRTSLDEIQLGGTTIPEGVLVTLAIAAGNRDPVRFADPDRFDPERRDNQHLGFGSGIHGCFGAPLARIEAQIAFTQLVQCLEQPRLIVDPPPYRPSPLLRGPEHLPIDVAAVRTTGKPIARAA